MIGKFGGKRIRVRRIDKGVPSHVMMTPVVWEWRYILVGFDENLRSLATNNGEERSLIRRTESRLKTKLVAVEGNGLIDVADDEAWRNRIGTGSWHKDGPPSLPINPRISVPKIFAICANARIGCILLVGLPFNLPAIPYEIRDVTIVSNAQLP